jgi:branched-subunit amino acid transport protein
MTTNQSTIRLTLYVAAAVLTALLPDIQTLGDVVTSREWASIAIKSLLAGIVTARAYIDKSPAEIAPTN